MVLRSPSRTEVNPLIEARAKQLVQEEHIRILKEQEKTRALGKTREIRKHKKKKHSSFFQRTTKTIFTIFFD